MVIVMSENNLIMMSLKLYIYIEVLLCHYEVTENNVIMMSLKDIYTATCTNSGKVSWHLKIPIFSRLEAVV